MQPSLLRNALGRLTALAAADLEAIWRQVSTASEARQALTDVLPAIIEKYGSAAGALAAEWYDQNRASQAIKGGFQAAPAVVGDRGTEALAGWAVGPLFSETPGWDSAKVLLSGGVQRRIADVARETVMSNSIADPHARGWQRVTNGGCTFCEMLAGRGTVYSESSADFSSHDHCECAAVPAFDGQAKPVQAYTPSGRNINDADRARVRDYLRTH